MKLGLAFLLVLALAIPAQAQTVLWFAGMETGDVSEFTSTGGGGSIPPGANAIAKTGQYGLNQAVGGTVGKYVVSKTGLALTTVYSRIDFQWSVANASFDEHIIQYVNAGRTYAIVLMLQTTSHKIVYKNNSGSVTAISTTALSSGTWYHLDIKCVVSASVGGCELKINGTVEFTSLSGDTSGLTAVDRAEFGGQSGVDTFTFAWDNIMICSGAYCPNGGTIARQGISGSPTYTAWTKNGCTSSLIENCWSNTPFTTGSNASDAVASDAQTMLLHGFDTTQTGHGSEVIAPHDTINACKTVAIAKSGTSSAPLSLRRRLASTDTDTAITLTTSDAYYDDGVATTPVVNLTGASVPEIGVLHGSGSATDTVEDMWFMCDYLAVGYQPKHRTIVH